MRPFLPDEDPPADTSFRCLPVVQPRSDENAAGFPSVRRGDSVRTPTDRSARFLGEPLIRRTLFDISAFPWCPTGTPRVEAGTTFSPACLMPVLPQPIRYQGPTV
ncbi:putative glutamate racemase [Trichinella spiralis]|uniref:putative glutamate racemase n=1 Tax=Trichinella spiralis TaxID=6334 RepID=UPI0001EFE751|nr:putative glutamate racemase [Trichinella spiralis]